MIDQAEYETLLIRREASRLFVTLNRPEARNAINREASEELIAVAEAVENDPSIRVVIVRGSEGTFCAGADIKEFRENFDIPLPEGGGVDPVAKNNRYFGDILLKFNNLSATTIGIVEGAAFGGGLGLTCVFDVAICMADTRFALSETGLGVIPAQIAPFVVQRVGLTTARQIALTGARFDGQYAFNIGLVHFCANDSNELDEMLKRVLIGVSLCAPGANATTKKLLMDTTLKPIEQVLDDGSEAFAAQLRSEEGREGVKAFIKKRRPSWAEPIE